MQNHENTIYVKEIPSGATYFDVRSTFAKHGTIKTVFLKDASPTKHAFVEFVDKTAAQRVLSLWVTVRGRAVKIAPRSPGRRNNARGGKPRSRKPAQSALPAVAAPPQLKPALELPEVLEFYEPHEDTPAPSSLGQVPDLHKSLEKCNSMTSVEESTTTKQYGTESGNIQTLAYGTNGELKMRSVKPTVASLPTRSLLRSAVLRVDGVQESWSAQFLVQALLGMNFQVRAAMIYLDIDERGLRQGLLEFGTVETATDLYELFGELRIGSSILTLTPSAINSIAPIRRSYSGRFVAYDVLDNMPQCPLQLPNPAQPQPQPQPQQMSPTFSVPNSEASAFSATSDWTPSTPPDKHSDVTTWISLSGSCCSPTLFPTPALPPAQGGGQWLRKTSQTLVIENAAPQFGRTAFEVAAAMSKFGSVQNADLVPIGMSIARAYVSFSTPSEAESAFCKLSGNDMLSIRLA